MISFTATTTLFVFLMILAWAGFFDPAARFDNGSIIKNINQEIGQDTGIVQDFLRELQTRFSATLKEPAVRRSFLPNQNAEDIPERSRLYDSLMDAQSGLRSVRFIDQGGGRIHYSTYSQDILSQKGEFVSYRTYNSSMDEIAFESIAAPGGGEPRIILDEQGEQLIFSMPFYDSLDVYRGTALFSLSLQAVSERLVNKGRIGAREGIAILQAPAGIILGLPGDGRDVLIPAIASIWRLQLLSLTPLEPGNSAVPAMISSRTDQGIYVGRLVDGAIVAFPRSMWILSAAFFCTAYLTIFLIFNFRQDTMTIVKSRVESLQTVLIEEYHNRKGPADWGRWSRELEQRREVVREEIKRDIKSRREKRLDIEIDACINNAWAELVAIIRSGTETPVPVFNEARLEEIVKRVLRTVNGNFASGRQAFVENRAAPETITGTQVPPGCGGVSGGRIAAFTRKAAAAENITEIEELTSGKETKVAIKDDGYKTNPVENEEIPGELEELEELEDIEELEELGEPAGKDETPSFQDPPALPREDIAVLAREIEFTPLPEDETGTAGGSSLSDLEIVSPFITMLSDLGMGSGVPADETGNPGGGIPEEGDGSSSLTQKTAPVKTSKLEMLGNYQVSLVYRPFTLENVPPEDLTPAEPVIVSRNGVNYINTAALEDEADMPLDKDFQRLVNSVLK
ncbi:MAG: hypothetical protein LBB98_11535 [Treponema sp.]|nr:hypothetical protein [Treponema sp.]